MKNSIKFLAIAACMLFSMGAYAQEEVTTEEVTTEESGSKYKGTLSLSVDAVSNAYWRGSKLAGFSIQPGIGFDIAGFNVGVWGSTDFVYGGDGYSELDWYIGYSNWGVSLTLTDYCWTRSYETTDGLTATVFDYFGKYADNHYLELSLGFDFGYYFEKVPIYINANTILYGPNLKSDGSQAYSTYLEVGYSYSVKKIVDLNLAVGAAIESGGAAMYSPNDGFSVVNIDLGASHDFNIKDICSIGVSADVIYNPATSSIMFVAGVGFAM